jgi:hypothetical protein
MSETEILEVVKLLSLLCGSTLGVISAATDTRKDGRLTAPGRRYIAGICIFGLFAMGAQIEEIRLNRVARRADQEKQDEQLKTLSRLSTDSQALTERLGQSLDRANAFELQQQRMRDQAATHRGDSARLPPMAAAVFSRVSLDIRVSWPAESREWSYYHDWILARGKRVAVPDRQPGQFVVSCQSLPGVEKNWPSALCAEQIVLGIAASEWVFSVVRQASTLSVDTNGKRAANSNEALLAHVVTTATAPVMNRSSIASATDLIDKTLTLDFGVSVYDKSIGAVEHNQVGPSDPSTSVDVRVNYGQNVEKSFSFRSKIITRSVADPSGGSMRLLYRIKRSDLLMEQPGEAPPRAPRQ